jgi:hypothetical protein
MKNPAMKFLPVLILLYSYSLSAQTRYTDRIGYENTLKTTNTGATSTQKITNIRQYLTNTEALYACTSTNTTYASMISPLSFKKLLLPLYTKAAANDEGIVKNGTSLSYSFNEDKATASVNYLVNFKEKSKWLLNIATSGSSDGSFIFISNKNKANYGFEVTPKFSYMFGRSSIFFDEDACIKLKAQRQTELYPSIIAKYQDITNINMSRINDSINAITPRLTTASVLTNNITSKRLKAFSDSLKSHTDILALYQDFLNDNGDSLLEKVKTEIADFEVKNAVTNGYTIHWIDFSLADKISNNNIFDSTIFAANRITQKQFNRVTFSLNYNYMRNVKRLMLYTNAGFKFYNSYALEGLKKETYDFSDTIGVEKSFKGYNNITNQDVNIGYLSTNFFVNLLMFFGEKKQWGIETSFDYTFQNQTAPISNGRIGAVCNILDPDDKDKSRSTVGIFLTLAQYYTSDPRMGDYMGVGFRLGVPLTKLIKEKK